jgi:hypothetical protein
MGATMKIQKPTLGRVVIFTAWRGHDEKDRDEYAGIIVRVHDQLGPGVVDIKTMGPHSLYDNARVPHDANGAGGTWRYPPHTKDEIEVAS